MKEIKKLLLSLIPKASFLSFCLPGKVSNTSFFGSLKSYLKLLSNDLLRFLCESKRGDEARLLHG